ncbi:MAG: hypothetical protein ACK4F7_07180 [Inhella sp.]
MHGLIGGASCVVQFLRLPTVGKAEAGPHPQTSRPPGGAQAELGKPAFSLQASIGLFQLHIAEDPRMSDTYAVTGHQVEVALIAFSSVTVLTAVIALRTPSDT